jgi:hypothetical protein
MFQFSLALGKPRIILLPLQIGRGVPSICLQEGTHQYDTSTYTHQYDITNDTHQ